MKVGDHEVPSVWVKDIHWFKLKEPRRCRMRGCKRTDARFALLRSNGPWAYCEDHMYGRVIVKDTVLIEVAAESPAALQGYYG